MADDRKCSKKRLAVEGGWFYFCMGWACMLGLEIWLVIGDGQEKENHSIVSGVEID